MFIPYTDPLIYGRKDQSWYVSNTPTGNCQIFSILYAHTLFTPYSKKEETRKEFKNAARHATKFMCYIDVKGDAVAKRVRDFFSADEIVFHTEFESTNGSNMHFFLLNLKWLYYENI